MTVMAHECARGMISSNEAWHLMSLPGALHLPQELTLHQPFAGYRFTADSVRLAAFVQVFPHEYLLDLCTGVAVVPLLVQERCSFKCALGVELQEELYQVALRNVSTNRLEGRIHLLHADVKFLTLLKIQAQTPIECPRGFDVISVNPPYYRVNQGKLNSSLQKSIARHELCLRLAELIERCRELLKDEGRLYLAHHVSREKEILCELRTNGFRHVNRRLVVGDLLLFEATS